MLILSNLDNTSRIAVTVVRIVSTALMILSSESLSFASFLLGLTRLVINAPRMDVSVALGNLPPTSRRWMQFREVEAFRNGSERLSMVVINGSYGW